MDVSGNTGAQPPVPQALYMNNNALAAVTVPSALQLQPFLSNAQSVATLRPAASAATSPASSSSSSSASSHPAVTTVAAAPLQSPIAQPGPPPALVPVSDTSNRHSISRPPPPYQPPPPSSASPRRPPSMPNQTPSPRCSSTSSTQSSDSDTIKVSLEAHQIRVGTRKYMPASNVVFKDDGVLFTLREYTNAPILLNARALIRCKAHLSTVHPVLFFALEASCVKQIRTIFHMSEDEFNEKDVLEKKRNITVFPKSLSAEEAAGIQQSFNTMKARFGRVDSILYHIDMDTAIDIIYGSSERGPSTNGGGTSAISASRSVATNGVASTASSSASRNHPYQRASQQQAHTAQQRQSQQLQQQQQQQQMHSQMQRPLHVQQQQRLQQTSMMTTPVAQGNGMMMQRMQRPQMAGNIRMPPPPNLGPPRLASVQPVTIPQDPASFAMLQKSLQPNMIYPVIDPQDPNRRVLQCLWTGTAFQSCQMEVVLYCHNIRVGSMRCPSGDDVHVKVENSRLGIHFKMKVKDTVWPLSIYEDELEHCFVCFQKVSAIFLFPNQAVAQRIRYVCKMKSTTKDPTYDPNTKEERQRHLILFLRNITTQQREEMLKLRRLVGPSNKPLFTELEPLGAAKIFSGIKSNAASSTGKVNEYAAGLSRGAAVANGSQALSYLSALAQEISTVDPVPISADDDDDDVIMTSEELTIKCPYTQQVMKDPVRNKNCNHNYERAAIMDFIAKRRAKGTDKSAKCPYAGCGNQIPLTIEDMEENRELKEYIRNKVGTAAPS